MAIERLEVRTSSRRVLRRCLRKWGYSSSFRRNLQRIGSETNINFWFGSAIHFAMEDYFGWNRFGDPRRAFKAYYEAFKPEDRPEGADVHYELGLAMLTYFLEWYPSHNADMQFKTLWLDENNHEVPAFTEGAHPAVEEEFTLDLGYRAVLDAATEEVIKNYETSDVMYLNGMRIEDPTVYPADTVFDLVVNAQHKKMDFFKEYDGNSIVEKIDTHLVKVVPVCYHGTMDKIVVDRYGRWWVTDYKTAKGADTRKLETDDQISAYLWAAEQRFQHPIYGFVYLQLTKDVAKPPKVLKDGTLSVDKKQKTTRKLFKEALIAYYGVLGAAPNKYIEMLNYLADLEEPEGDRFIRWDFVTRNDSQKINTYKNIMAETKMMLNSDLYLFPNPTRDCGWDCPFREICIALEKGEEDIEHLISMSFEPRATAIEHNDEDWKKNLKYPDGPVEAAALDDVELVPQNIFNIELPAKYYEDNWEE